jgi:hypothetical protein
MLHPVSSPLGPVPCEPLLHCDRASKSCRTRTGSTRVSAATATFGRRRVTAAPIHVLTQRPQVVWPTLPIREGRQANGSPAFRRT